MPDQKPKVVLIGEHHLNGFMISFRFLDFIGPYRRSSNLVLVEGTQGKLAARQIIRPEDSVRYWGWDNDFLFEGNRKNSHVISMVNFFDRILEERPRYERLLDWNLRDSDTPRFDISVLETAESIQVNVTKEIRKHVPLPDFKFGKNSDSDSWESFFAFERDRCLDFNVRKAVKTLETDETIFALAGRAHLEKGAQDNLYVFLEKYEIPYLVLFGGTPDLEQNILSGAGGKGGISMFRYLETTFGKKYSNDDKDFLKRVLKKIWEISSWRDSDFNSSKSSPASPTQP